MVQQLLSAKDLKAQTDAPMMSTNTGAKPGYVSGGLPVNKGLPKASVAVPNAQPIGAIAGVNAPSPVQQAVSTAQKSPATQKDFTNAFSPKAAPTNQIPENIPVVKDNVDVDKGLSDLTSQLTEGVRAGKTINIDKLKSAYPEFSHVNNEVLQELTNQLSEGIKAGKTLNMDKLKQAYPELTPEQIKSFADMNTYEKIMYIPKNAEERKTLPTWKRVLSVGTPTQETATAMGATKNDVDVLEQNVRGTLDSLAGFGKGANALLDKLLGGDGVGVQILNDYAMQTRGQTIGDLMESNPEDYKALLKEIEEGKADALKTTATQDVLNIAEGGLASAQLAAAPMLFAGITVFGSTDVGSKAMEAVNATFGGVGSVVNMVPGLSDFKATLPEADQERFDVFVGNVIGSLLLGTRGKKNIIKDPKTFIAENVGSKQIIDNFKQNVIGLTEPVVKAAEVVKDKLNPNINLEEAAMTEAKKNPYIAEVLNAIDEATDGEMSKVDTSNTPTGFKNAAVKKVGDEYIQPKLDELENTYSDGGELYQDIRKSGQKVDVSNLVEETNAAIEKYAPSSLTPGDERLIAAVKKQVEKIVKDSQDGRFTADVALDSRRAISDLTNWDEQGQRRQQSNSKGDSVVKDVRKILDEKMKTQIAGLRELDALASKKIKEIAEFKKQLIKQDGSINYNNLKDTNTLAKTDLANKLDEYVPGATDRIDAIDKAIKIAKQTKGVGWVGSMVSKQAMGAIGAILGSILGPIGASVGAVMGLILEPAIEGIVGGKLSEANKTKVLKFFGELSPEAKLRLVEINNKIEQNAELSAADKKLIETAKQKFKDASSSKKDINATPSDTKPTSNDTNTPNPTKKGLTPKEINDLKIEEEFGLKLKPTSKGLQPKVDKNLTSTPKEGTISSDLSATKEMNKYNDIVMTEAYSAPTYELYAKGTKAEFPEMTDIEIKDAYAIAQKWKSNPVSKALVDYKLAVTGGSAGELGNALLKTLETDKQLAPKIAEASKDIVKEQNIKEIYRYGDKEGYSRTTKPDEYFANGRPLQTMKVTPDVLDRIVYAEGAETKLGYEAFPNTGEGEIILKPKSANKGLPTKDLQPLYEEARKYKSAEEFIDNLPLGGEKGRNIGRGEGIKWVEKGKSLYDFPKDDLRNILNEKGEMPKKIHLYRGSSQEGIVAGDYLTINKNHAKVHGEIQEYFISPEELTLDWKNDIIYRGEYDKTKSQLKQIREEANLPGKGLQPKPTNKGLQPNKGLPEADTTTYYHGTTKAGKEGILKNGFKPSKEGIYGPGVYLSNDIGDTLKNGGETLKVKINVNKIKELGGFGDYKIDIGESNKWIKDNPDMLKGISTDTTPMKGGVSPRQSDIYKKYMKSKGYDGVYIKDKNYTLIFDPKNVNPIK